MKLSFFVPGQQRPAGSKKAFKNPKTGQIIVTHDNPKTKEWMQSVKWFAMKAADRMALETGPVKLTLLFLADRPKGHFGTGRNAGILKTSAPAEKLTMPDLTKLTRAVEDAMKLVVWKDDSQVVKQDTEKRFCRADEKPGVCVTIETFERSKDHDKETEETAVSKEVQGETDPHNGDGEPDYGRGQER